jgi:hypothetical protein
MPPGAEASDGWIIGLLRDEGRRIQIVAPIVTSPGDLLSALRVRREKAALSSGCKAHPATAPAGSNRSSHGGNKMAEAFGVSAISAFETARGFHLGRISGSS